MNIYLRLLKWCDFILRLKKYWSMICKKFCFLCERKFSPFTYNLYKFLACGRGREKKLWSFFSLPIWWVNFFKRYLAFRQQISFLSSHLKFLLWLPLQVLCFCHFKLHFTKWIMCLLSSSGFIKIWITFIKGNWKKPCWGIILICVQYIGTLHAGTKQLYVEGSSTMFLAWFTAPSMSNFFVPFWYSVYAMST